MKKIFFAVMLAGAVTFTSCAPKGPVTKGSLSKFDTLSYAMGVNIGTGMDYQMRDLPIDVQVFAKGVGEGALEKGSKSRDEVYDLLRDYFMNKRRERMRAIIDQRKEADSIRLASGDTTKVEYPVADPAMFETEQEREDISYALGLDMGMNMRSSEVPIQTVWVEKGILDVKEGTPQIEEQKANEYLQNYFMVTRPAENKAASEEWLSKIEKKSGVKKTESGLLYKVTKQGDPDVIAKNPRDVVKVHYKGTKRNGQVFDASRFADKSKEAQQMMRKQRPDDFNENGTPKEGDKEAEFPLNRVIKGWTEGLQLVGKGGKITLWIPSDLAYGQRGNRGIGPNEALCFEVEVVDVKPYEEPVKLPADSLPVPTRIQKK